MTDRPILFSGSMVCAILEGRKTQTRRVVKIPAIMGNRVSVGPHEDLIELEEGEFCRGICHYASTGALSGPYRLGYATGDRLWVRESHALVPATAYRMSEGVQQTTNPGDPHMAAVYASGWERSKPQWRPSIHMPRWASRITLTVTDVRVQRLQDISADDALAEGVIRQDPTPEDEAWNRQWCEGEGIEADPLEPVWLAPGTRQGFGARPDDPKWGPTPEFAFRLLWDSINGDRPGCAWQENPWVVAITFRPIFRNIDEVRHG